MNPIIWAIGRNYKQHALEMKAPIPKVPMVFTKAMACVTTKGMIEIPPFTSDLQHELEIAVRLGADLLPKEIALALDLTARDIQSLAKEKGHPWTLAKSFKDSCPLSRWIPFQNQQWFQGLEFTMRVNNQIRQKGCVKDMIFSLPHLLTYLDEHFPLTPGDIILTGTPAGVNTLTQSDEIFCELNGHFTWKLKVHP